MRFTLFYFICESDCLPLHAGTGQAEKDGGPEEKSRPPLLLVPCMGVALRPCDMSGARLPGRAVHIFQGCLNSVFAKRFTLFVENRINKLPSLLHVSKSGNRGAIFNVAPQLPKF